MNNRLAIDDDLLIQCIFKYLNSYDISNFKKISKYYFHLVENNKKFIYNLILNNNHQITFNKNECNYCFYYTDVINKHKYGFTICNDFPIEECINRFNIMLKHHNYNILI